MKNNVELCKEAFSAINEFKRSRTLADIARSEGNTEKAIYSDLKAFRAFDRIELAVRAIQSNERVPYNEGSKDEMIRAIN